MKEMSDLSDLAINAITEGNKGHRRLDKTTSLSMQEKASLTEVLHNQCSTLSNFEFSTVVSR